MRTHNARHEDTPGKRRAGEWEEGATIIDR